MHALVTGANGFLGSWLTRDLVKRGVETRVLLRRPHEAHELSGLDVELVQGDVTEAKSLKAAFQGIDAVFHLAGVVGYSRAQREIMEQVNVRGVENVIEACLEAQVKRLVHLSSVVAVGASFRKGVLNENSPYNLEHLDLGYFETKRKGEKAVVKAVFEKGLDAVILNPSTIYGPGDAKKGSRSVQLKVARGKFPFYTSGGVSIVDVEDVVDGIWRAYEKGRRGERYILSGENLTIAELFRAIAEEAGVKPPSIYLPNVAVHAIGRVGDLMEKIGRKGPLNSENAWTATLFHWFDHTKATKDLGFQPRPARESLKKSIDWIKAQGLL